MTATAASFRDRFPEFGDAAAFSDTQIELWLEFATNMLTPSQAEWGNVFDVGVCLLAAHHLASSKQNSAGIVGGNVTGQVSGPVTSKAIAGMSKSYAAPVQIDGAGAYNRTSYGVQFFDLAANFGAGGMQL